MRKIDWAFALFAASYLATVAAAVMTTTLALIAVGL